MNPDLHRMFTLYYTPEIQAQQDRGDISLAMVAHAWSTKPWLSVEVHDITSDAIPRVDLLWHRDQLAEAS